MRGGWDLLATGLSMEQPLGRSVPFLFPLPDAGLSVSLPWTRKKASPGSREIPQGPEALPEDGLPFPGE